MQVKLLIRIISLNESPVFFVQMFTVWLAEVKIGESSCSLQLGTPAFPPCDRSAKNPSAYDNNAADIVDII